MFARGLGFAFIAIRTAVCAQTSIEDTAPATTIFGANRQAAPAFGVAITAAVFAGVATDSASAGRVSGDVLGLGAAVRACSHCNVLGTG